MSVLNQEMINKLMKDGYTLHKQGKKRESAEVWLTMWELIQKEVENTNVTGWEDLVNDPSEEEKLREWLKDLICSLDDIAEDAELVRLRKDFMMSYRANTRNPLKVEDETSLERQPSNQQAMQQELARQLNTMPLKENNSNEKENNEGADTCMSKQESNHDRQERQKQKELQDHPGGGLRDGADRAGSGGLVDLVNALGAKGIGILILVIAVGYLVFAMFIR